MTAGRPLARPANPIDCRGHGVKTPAARGIFSMVEGSDDKPGGATPDPAAIATPRRSLAGLDARSAVSCSARGHCLLYHPDPCPAASWSKTRWMCRPPTANTAISAHRGRGGIKRMYIGTARLLTPSFWPCSGPFCWPPYWGQQLARLLPAGRGVGEVARGTCPKAIFATSDETRGPDPVFPQP